MVVVRTPRPYRETKLEENRVLREFGHDTNSEELIWHQDLRDRQVLVIKSGGWKLQMQEGLPFPLQEGRAYWVPAHSWHRVIRGHGNLVIEIREIF